MDVNSPKWVSASIAISVLDSRFKNLRNGAGFLGDLQGLTASAAANDSGGKVALGRGVCLTGIRDGLAATSRSTVHVRRGVESLRLRPFIAEDNDMSRTEGGAHPWSALTEGWPVGASSLPFLPLS